MKTLVYGIGNTGRRDDALGVLCARKVEAWCAETGTSGIEVRAVFQLTVEEAETIGGYDRVLFCDASIAGVGEVALLPVAPDESASFPTHAMTPGSILFLARELYGPPPEAHVLHLRGEEFGAGEALSRRGERNLAEGFRRIVQLLTSEK